jgi:Domain of unknown function (DUF4440)
MRYIIYTLFTFYVTLGLAQKDNFETNIEKLHSALINKDSLAITYLMHDSLSYGHSNGLLETKCSLWQNLKSNYIKYYDIKYKQLKIQSFNNTKIVRYSMDVNVDFENKNFNLELHNQQTWLFQNKRWQLIARQATKISK